MHPFDRCGLASLDDFDAPEYRSLFATLEAAQLQFASREDEFRTGAYAWERDPLHGWSRSWEYPYAYHHLSKWKAAQHGRNVIDVGSGVTFFPFCLAREGFAVTCVDNDPVAGIELRKAAAIVPALPGSVTFHAGDAARLPFADNEADAAYCISVLEHTEDPAGIVSEIARVLRPGGLFVLTIDLDLLGTAALGPRPFAALRSALEARYVWAVPETTIHPARMLENFNGPYPRLRQGQVPGIMWRTRRGALKPLIGGPIAGEPLRLACFAGVFARLDTR